MDKTTSHQLKLGLLVIAGLSFFVVSVYLLGKQQNLFDAVFKIKSSFSDVKGLRIGNSIRFSGINIGMVTDIEIQNDSTIFVEMSIKREVQPFIRKDSEAEIENEGLVGSKVITIHPGSNDLPMVEKGDLLSSKDVLTTDDILEQAKDILVDAKRITENLSEVSHKLNNGSGDLSVLLNQRTITPKLSETADRLADITLEVERIAAKINEGEGDLGLLLNNDTISRQIKGILHELDSSAKKVEHVTQDLHQASRQIHEGNNVLNKLLYDSTLAKQMDTTLIKVNRGLDEAREAAETIGNSWILNLFSNDKKEKRSETNN